MADIAWRKATASNPKGNCVEAAPAEGWGVYLRDTKDPTGHWLAFTRDEFAAFLDGAKRGEFDSLTTP